jgi:hypothetical protein
MRRLWIIMAAVLAFGGLALIAPSAGAASTPSAKFCAAASKIGDGSSSQPTPAQAKRIYKQFVNAGKYAPGNVKKAAAKIGSVLKALGSVNGKDPASLAKFYTSANFKDYGKAVTTFFTYAAQCTS